MGNALNYSMALTGIGKQDERKLLMLGMGGAGKTSILYKLNIGQNIHPVPFTMGIDAEIFEYKKNKNDCLGYDWYKTNNEKNMETFL